MSSLSMRSLTGALFGLFVLGSVFLGPLFFALAMLLVQLGLVWEFMRLAGIMNARLHKPFLLISSIALYLYMVLAGWGILAIDVYLAAVVFPVFLLLLIAEIYKPGEADFRSLFFTIFALIYITIPIAMLNLIYAIGKNQSNSLEIIIALFMIIWVYDTFAYLVGVRFGKHRLFERISPKKSWEGLIGGSLFTIVFTLVFSGYFTALNLWQWLSVAVIIIIFGTFGDLFESRLKRMAGIKDSGNILPGHGGLLDRFDAILFAAPAVWCFLVLFY